MPLFPAGDPRRPLQLAVRSMRGLGILFCFIGGLMILFLALSGRGRVAFSNFALFLGLFYLLPGAALLVLAIFLNRRQTWAAVAGIVLASIIGLFAVASLVGLAAGGGGIFELLIAGLVIAAMAQLIVHLSKSFASIRHFAVTEPGQRGFDPLPAQPVYPYNPPPAPPS